MIICLSGFVIAGTSPSSLPGALRNDISALDRISVCAGGAGPGAALGAAGARYSPHHHQLLQQFAPLALRSSSSSAESVSSHSASPPPPRPGAGVAGAGAGATGATRCTRVRTLYACLGESEGELSFEPNQIVTNVAASGEPGWLRGSLNGKTGLVPENYVEPLP